MKTVSRLVRRYILTAFGIVLLIFLVNFSIFAGILIRFGNLYQRKDYLRIGDFAAAFHQEVDGNIRPFPETAWQSRYAWAMLLDDSGTILWSGSLPENLNHAYTVADVASFSRWYLDDYPVFVYRNDFGLLVAGLPRDSMTRFDFYMDNDILSVCLSGFPSLLTLDGAVILFLCLLLGWRAAEPLRKIGAGIDCLAEGKPISLKVKGSAAELAEKLNRTSARLQEQTAFVERRDTARTNWIAGVSHDIRTPLALILGYAEQLVQVNDLEARKKASVICVQCGKIKSLVEDLNLTSKLQYHSQPLRLREVKIAPLLRKCAAHFFDTVSEPFEFEVFIQETVEPCVLSLDADLWRRAMDNLLNNCVRHNSDGCKITLQVFIQEEALFISVQDNGKGFPETVLALLSNRDSESTETHILGLHLVQQIMEAHGGTIHFKNDGGAIAEIALPLKRDGDGPFSSGAIL